MKPRPRAPDWTDIFLPAEERRLILREEGARWGLRVFIESGTNDGATPMFLRDDFNQLHTIELGVEQYQSAVERFKTHPQVRCWQGDSAVVLPAVLASFDGPALVWLDGHFSGPATARGPVDTPVRDELRTLFADGRPHVILVDDMRCFDGGAEHHIEEHYASYPSISWVAQTADEHGYDFDLADDIGFLTPRT